MHIIIVNDVMPVLIISTDQPDFDGGLYVDSSTSYLYTFLCQEKSPISSERLCAEERHRKPHEGGRIRRIDLNFIIVPFADIINKSSGKVPGIGTRVLENTVDHLLFPRLTKLFFCNTSNQGGFCNPSLDFPNRTLYEIDFGINR